MMKDTRRKRTVGRYINQSFAQLLVCTAKNLETTSTHNSVVVEEVGRIFIET